MPANFGWVKSRKLVVAAAEAALKDVGFVLYARRLNLDRSQEVVAAKACEILGQQNAIRQPDIDVLEDGRLPTHIGGAGYTRIKAILRALEWKEEDIEFMAHMIKEFARIE